MQNTKLIKKISTSLVSTGEIIDSLQSNSSTNAPSIRAVVDNMTPPMNLLINGDFQVNQRGQSEYTSASHKVIYTLDMWKVNTNSNITVKPITNGVQLICSSFTGTSLFGQEMDFKLLRGTFTLVSKIDGQIYSHVFENVQATNSHDLGNGMAFWINSSDSYNTVGLLFKENKTINVEYIDLFEGDIAYPHIPEDDAIALLRCQDYEIFYETLLLTISYDYNERKFQAVANFPKMKDIPTFTHGQVEMWANTGSMMVIGVESKEALIDRIRITTQTTPYPKKSGACIIFLHDVNLTCEPL